MRMWTCSGWAQQRAVINTALNLRSFSNGATTVSFSTGVGRMKRIKPVFATFNAKLNVLEYSQWSERTIKTALEM